MSFDLSILQGNYLNEISEPERSKLFRFIYDRDFFKAGSTLSRYIGNKDSFVKEFMNKLASSNNENAIIAFSNLLNFDFDNFIKTISNETIENAFESIYRIIDNNYRSNNTDIRSLGGAISGILVINYEKFSEEFRLNIIKNITKTKIRNSFFQVWGGFSEILFKLPEDLRYELLLSRVDESTTIFCEFYNVLPDEVKEKGLSKIINVNNSLWYCYNYSEKFPENIKKVFYDKVFNIIIKDNPQYNNIGNFEYFYSPWDRYFELDDSRAFLINHFDKYNKESQNEIIKNLISKSSNKFLIENLNKISKIIPNDTLINLVYFLTKDGFHFISSDLFNFEYVWNKLPEELILKFLPIILDADKNRDGYDLLNNHLSKFFNSLSNELLNKVIKSLITKKIDNKYLLLSLSNNISRIPNEIRKELISKFSSSESNFHYFIRNLAENLNNLPPETCEFIFQFLENKVIRKNSNYIFYDNVTKYSYELILLLLDNKNTKEAISYAIVNHFDKLSPKISDEFINRIGDEKEFKPLLSSFKNGFNYINIKSKILLLESLAKTDNILNKRVISLLLLNEFNEKYNYNELSPDFINKILSLIYIETDDEIQFCISQIITKKFYDISEELRNKIINLMLDSPKSYLYLHPIIEKNFLEINEKLSGEANLLLSKAMKNSENNQIYLIMILDRFFSVISKDLREKVFFILLEYKDYLTSMARIFRDNFSTFETNKEIIFLKLIDEPKSLKTIINLILDNFKEIPDFLKEKIIEFSLNNQISKFFLWQTVINYNSLNNDIIEKLFNNFKNTENPETAKKFILALFNKNSDIPDEQKKNLLINLISLKDIRLIFYKNLWKVYKNLSEDTKMSLLNFLNIDSDLFTSIIKLIIHNKSLIPLSLQVSILKELSNDLNSYKNIAKILKLNFKSFPENFRNELIHLLFKDKYARRNIVQTIVYESENLSPNIHNLIIEAYKNNINLNKLIINKLTNDNKKAVLVNLSKFNPNYYYNGNLEEYIIITFLFECINNPQKIIEKLKIIGINDEDLFVSISNLFESKKIVNFLATTLRLHYYKFPEEIAVSLLNGFINYKYDFSDHYLWFYVVGAIKFNPKKIPKEIVLQVIKKLNKNSDWRSDMALEIKKLIF